MTTKKNRTRESVKEEEEDEKRVVCDVMDGYENERSYIRRRNEREVIIDS